MSAAPKDQSATQFEVTLLKNAALLTERSVKKLQAAITLEAFGRIGRRTPVSNVKGKPGGRARGNWQTTLGKRAEGTLDIFDPSGATALAGANAAVSQLSARDFTTVYITNNLPYIIVLEFGLYPTPTNKPIKIAKSTFVTKKNADGTFSRRLKKLSAKQRADRYSGFIGSSKVTPDGYSIKAPRGMVGITMEEMRTLLGSSGFVKQVMKTPDADSAV